MMRYTFLLLTFLLSFKLWAQPQLGLVAYYSFENCDAKDVSLNNSDGIVFGEPVCGCGVQGNSLYFDGMDDYAVLTGNVETFFRASRFTLSFYFRVDDQSGTHDILSKRLDCDNDHAFSIRYVPATHTLLVDLAESDTVRTAFTERIDPSLCWVHLVVVKDKISHKIYVNGNLIASKDIPDFIDLTNASPLHIANSPCIGSTDRRFKGFIDEMRVYNRVLDINEIQDLYLAPDRIVSHDTTIYKGGTAILNAGITCANSISWAPAALVTDANSGSTSSQPTNSQTFTATYQYGGCSATDTVRVNVVDPSEIECGEVPMPNAFTPNADGRNDRFFISNPFALEQLQAFEIFDRLGNRVFATTDVSDSWDGTYNGQELNPGLYLYKLKYTCQGKDQVKTGSVMLLR
ncbi:MAG: gliding motility-associated C-terminal domain-containing protein [Saprospiraceae bacterium]|nr:gliding motility-associated C-terminal domain-containing protein [Saprospiraceae bacterium]